MPKQLRPRSKYASDADNLIEWASRVFAVMILMVLPGLAGFYLDGLFGIRWLTPIGFALGMLVGMASLILIVKRMELEKKKSRPDASVDHFADLSSPDSEGNVADTGEPDKIESQIEKLADD